MVQIWFKIKPSWLIDGLGMIEGWYRVSLEVLGVTKIFGNRSGFIHTYLKLCLVHHIGIYGK